MKNKITATLSQKQTLRTLLQILGHSNGLVQTLTRERQYYDDPKFWYYSATLHDRFLPHNGLSFSTSASGCSFFSKDSALLKCLAESVERYCNYHFENKFVSRYAAIDEVRGAIIPLERFARYSQKQLNLRTFKKYVFASDQKIHWTDCASLATGKKSLIPCTSMYLSCPYVQTEPLLYPPISTGVAGGSSVLDATVRGIYEVIERDAYTIAYLRRVHSPKIRLDSVKDERVQHLLYLASRYNMELICLDLTTDLKIPVVGALVIDKTGIGKAVSLGLKSDLNVNQAIIGSITEAFHTRGWIRRVFEEHADNQKSHKHAPQSNMLKRGLWWYPRSKIRLLNFWITGKQQSSLEITDEKTSLQQKYDYLVQQLQKHSCSVYYKNMTLPTFEKLPYYVVKVIIPELQPLIFDEKHPVLGGYRLSHVPKILGLQHSRKTNHYPHLFI